MFAIPSSSEGTEPWSGAVTSVLPDPRDPNVAFVGTANGGIWRTADLGDATPVFTPDTDKGPSLSIAR